MTSNPEMQTVQHIITAATPAWSNEVFQAFGRQLAGAINAQCKVNDLCVVGRALSVAIATAVKQGAR